MSSRYAHRKIHNSPERCSRTAAQSTPLHLACGRFNRVVDGISVVGCTIPFGAKISFDIAIHFVPAWRKGHLIFGLARLWPMPESVYTCPWVISGYHQSPFAVTRVEPLMRLDQFDSKDVWDALMCTRFVTFSPGSTTNPRASSVSLRLAKLRTIALGAVPKVLSSLSTIYAGVSCVTAVSRIPELSVSKYLRGTQGQLTRDDRPQSHQHGHGKKRQSACLSHH